MNNTSANRLNVHAGRCGWSYIHESHLGFKEKVALISLVFMPFSFSPESLPGQYGLQVGDFIFAFLVVILIVDGKVPAFFLSKYVSPFFGFYFLFLIYTAMTLLWSPSFAWLRFIQHIYVLFTCIIYYHILKRIDIEFLIRFTAITTSIVAWVSLIGGVSEYVTGSYSTFVEGVSGRLVGVFREPNQLSIFLVPMGVIVFYQALHGSIHARIAWLFNFIVCFIDIVLTGSDGGVIILSISVFIFSMLMKGRPLIYISIAISLFLGVCFYFGIDFSNIKGVLNILNSLSDLEQGADPLHSLGGHRLDMWREAAELLSESIACLVFGFGEGSFPVISYENSLHNTYMNVLFSYGLVGLILFILLIISLLIIIFHIRNVQYRFLMLSVFAALSMLGLGHWIMKSRVLMFLIPLLLLCYQQNRQSRLGYEYKS